MFYASSNVRMPLQTDSTYCTLIGLPAKNLSTFINETRYNANGKYTSYSHYCFVELCARYVDSLSLSLNSSRFMLIFVYLTCNTYEHTGLDWNIYTYFIDLIKKVYALTYVSVHCNISDCKM